MGKEELLTAIVNNNTDLALCLIAEEVNPNATLNITIRRRIFRKYESYDSEKKGTFLHEAVKIGNPKITEALLLAGANTNEAGADYLYAPETPLCLAVRNQNKELV